MNFNLDSDQVALQDSVRRLLENEYDFESRRAVLATDFGFEPKMWQALADQGVLATGLPEAHGGFGGPVEVMLVMEEIGKALVLEPFMSTVAMCAPLLAESGTPELQATLLQRVASGHCRMALAHYEADARYALDFVNTRARSDGDAFVLNGEKSVVLDGAVADLLIVSARSAPDDRLALFLVEPDTAGLNRVSYRTQDGRNAADISLRDVRITSAARLGTASDAFPALQLAIDRGIAALCAEAVGIMEALNAATLEYLKNRRQFGMPIGRFQALQHRMADMFVWAVQARSMSLLATGKCAAGNATDRQHAIGAAKAFIGKASRFIGQHAVQLHGGMGIADELAVSHYFKRLTLIDSTFGDVAHHVAAISDAEASR